jgi:hypothetical protein
MLKMKKNKSPEIIDVSVDTLEGLKARIVSNALFLEKDKSILIAIVSTYAWIQAQLRSTKFTIHRLKRLFGFSSEKQKKGSEKTKGSSLALDLSTLGELNPPEPASDPIPNPPKGSPTKK